MTHLDQIRATQAIARNLRIQNELLERIATALEASKPVTIRDVEPES